MRISGNKFFNAENLQIMAKPLVILKIHFEEIIFSSSSQECLVWHENDYCFTILVGMEQYMV